MAPDWSCCLELLREMDLLCFCPGKGSHWAGVLTFPQPYSPVHNVCVPESLPASPATRHQHREELSWTQQLPFALLLLPVSPCSSQSTGILGTFKHQMHEQAPPPRVQCTRCAGPSTQVRSVLLCAHGEFACTDLSY